MQAILGSNERADPADGADAAAEPLGAPHAVRVDVPDAEHGMPCVDACLHAPDLPGLTRTYPDLLGLKSDLLSDLPGLTLTYLDSLGLTRTYSGRLGAC